MVTPIACRVLSDLGDCTCRRIRRSRRIRQWRGADAGYDACRVLSGHYRERTCRADKAFTPHPPARCRCRMRRLPGPIRPGGLHMSGGSGVHAASAGAVQMPDATLVASYPAYGNEHVGRIRRRAASASGAVRVDATLVGSYPAYGNEHVGRIRRHAASASGEVQMPDATLVASYPAYGNEHVGRIRR
ncbi:hypothetical protein ACLB1E_10635 [Escherichia coli]